MGLDGFQYDFVILKRDADNKHNIWDDFVVDFLIKKLNKL